MLSRHITIWLLLSVATQHTTAQVNLDSLAIQGICCATGYAIPNIQGMPLPKGVEINRERSWNFDLESNFTASDSLTTDRVQRFTRSKAKINFPIINQDEFKLIGGLRYYQDEFNFETPDSLNNFFHDGLQDKHIKTLGLSVFAVKTRIGNQYWASRASYRLNGDFTSSDLSSHQKYAFSLVYGWKLTRFKTWGFGVSYSNTFGISSVYPIWFWKQKYKNNFALDLFLPVYSRVYYLPKNGNNVFYLEARVEGDNYNLNFDQYQNQPLYLEKANIVSRLTYERRIYDFVWCSLSAGYQYNVSYNLSTSDLFFDRSLNPNNRNKVLIDSRMKPLPLVRVGLFLVPPRKWVEEKM